MTASIANCVNIGSSYTAPFKVGDQTVGAASRADEAGERALPGVRLPARRREDSSGGTLIDRVCR